MRPPHVLHLIDSLRRGGAELLLLHLAPGLQRHGFRVSVGYSTPGPLREAFQRQGIPTYPLPRLGRLDPLLGWRMWRLIRRLRPDIVHTHLFKSHFFGRPAACLAGTPWIVATLHNTDPWLRYPPAAWLYGLTARCAHRLLAVSEAVRRHHVRYTPLPPERVAVLENGIDLSRFEHLSAAAMQVRETLGIPPQAPLIGVVGRLVPAKGQALFLQAAARIRTRFPEARFLIVGEGPQEEALRALAQQLGLGTAVRFTGFWEEIPALLAALDVLVVASRYEGLPLVLLEGMAAGTAVVATDVGGVREALGSAGILVPPGDAAALARACERLLQDASLRRRLGAAARQRVQARYSLERTLNALVDLYRQLLAERIS